MKSNKKSFKSRRDFLKTSLMAGAGLSLLGHTLSATAQDVEVNPNSESAFAKAPLNILILGGTSFLGPHQIAYALGRGHTVSIFSRGKTKPTIYKDLFDNVEHLIGDRVDNLEALKGRKWDAVIDNSGREAKWTRDTAELLKDNVGLYLYTSSTGVYFPYMGSNIAEDTKLVLEVPEGVEGEEAMEYGYGVMKANSEIETIRAFGKKRSIIVRPTYMMGPSDQTDRFTYWPVRLNAGGEILVPGKSDDPVQYIDVRDVANWMIRLIEDENAGTYNAVGPASKTGMHAFVYGAHAAFNSKASFVNIDDYEFLKKNDYYYNVPWIMPEGKFYGSARESNDLAIENGLTFRPLAESVRDIYAWWISDAVTEERRIKMESGADSYWAKEKEIIKAWKSRRK